MKNIIKRISILSMLGFGGGGTGTALGGAAGLVVSGGTLEPGGIEPGNGSKYHVFTSPQVGCFWW